MDVNVKFARVSGSSCSFTLNQTNSMELAEGSIAVGRSGTEKDCLATFSFCLNFTLPPTREAPSFLFPFTFRKLPLN